MTPAVQKVQMLSISTPKTNRICTLISPPYIDALCLTNMRYKLQTVVSCLFLST